MVRINRNSLINPYFLVRRQAPELFNRSIKLPVLVYQPEYILRLVVTAPSRPWPCSGNICSRTAYLPLVILYLSITSRFDSIAVLCCIYNVRIVEKWFDSQDTGFHSILLISYLDRSISPLHPTMQPSRNEPIAIIRMGCRFPGEASSPSKLWDLLHNPRDVARDIPIQPRPLLPPNRQPSRYHQHPPGLPPFRRRARVRCKILLRPPR